MNYFIGEIEIFDLVRESVDFSRVSRIFDEIFVIFGLVKNGEKLDFTGFARTKYRTSIG